MKRMIIACMLFAAAAYTFTACNSAEEPVIAQPDGQTTPMTRAATIENFARHLIVEVNDVNILNAGEYYLSNGEPFFTHVVIYSSNIRGDANGNVYAYNNPNNAAILADPAKYYNPLQPKGINDQLGKRTQSPARPSGRPNRRRGRKPHESTSRIVLQPDYRGRGGRRCGRLFPRR